MKQPEKHRKRLHALIDQIERSPQVATNQEHLISLFGATIKDGIRAGAFRESNARGRAIYMVTALVGVAV